MAEEKFYITFHDGTRKEMPNIGKAVFEPLIEPSAELAAELAAPRIMPTIIGAPAVYDPHKCVVLPIAKKQYTVHVNLDGRGKRAMKEMARFLQGRDYLRREQALRDGLRLLKMWQKEKEPHRKAYYWHLHELKLARALGKDTSINFVSGGSQYSLSLDHRHKPHIYKLED